jgi:sortase (surface protein transpeptidase)
MLVIPRLGVKMPIVAVAVDVEGAMALPPRPTQIGWYAYGPRPGASHGSAVLGGHVDSRKYGVGPLVALQRLRPGDDVIVVTEDRTERFRVRSVQLVSKQGLDLGKVFDRDGERLLRIITCGGTFRRLQGGYQANVVVTALPR